MTSKKAPAVRLVEIGPENWRTVAAVAARPDQAKFVANTTYYLCLSHFDRVWNCFGIESDGEMVGHVMWGLENDEGWIGGLVIDAAQQGRGIGQAAVNAISAHLAAMPEVNQLALSYEPENTVARRLYARLGFVETGEVGGDELVARRPV